jgi:hypothetical protein
MPHTPIRHEPAAARSTQPKPCRPIRGGPSCAPAGDVSDAELARCRAEIAKLLPLWPRELADMSPSGRARLIAALERALRAERRRGVAGHWTYNLARHVQLLHAYRAETAAAQRSRASAPPRDRRARGNPE